jgi:hypothetical protein
MVITIKSNASPSEIEQALQKLNKKGKVHKISNKQFDAHKYCGVIKLKEDPLAIQKKMRNEWQ